MNKRLFCSEKSLHITSLILFVKLLMPGIYCQNCSVWSNIEFEWKTNKVVRKMCKHDLKVWWNPSNNMNEFKKNKLNKWIKRKEMWKH